MAELVLAPETPAAPALRRRTLLAGVLLASFASLLLELALTRLFSVVLFYHFAFLAISVALLGLGAGGVFAYVWRERLARRPTRRLAAALCAANAVLIVLVLQVVIRVPVSLELTWRNFGKLTVIYLAAAAPFFLTGLLFSTVFARESSQITRLYGSDLAGGALAGLAVVPLLNWVGGPNAILAAAAAMAAASLVWAETGRARRVAGALLALLLVAIAVNHSGRLVDVVYAKGKKRDPAWVEFAKWNAISRVEVDNQEGARYIVIDADASTAIMNVDPGRWGETAAPAGGADKVGSLSAPGYNWKQDLMSAAPAVVNVLRPRGEYAIIGPGGGVDVLRAVANGSPRVVGIEINPIIVNDIMRGRYAGYSYRLYERPEVEIHVSDGRSWIRSSRDKFDVLQMTLVDTWAATAAGAFALSENNLYTVEAFREYFEHLKPDGMLAITRWEFARPREALRVVAQGMETLRRLGVTDARAHFIVVSDGDLDEDGRPVLVLVKKCPFTVEEEAAVEAHVAANRNLAVLHLPSKAQAGAGGDSGAFAAIIASGDARSFAAQYLYNVAPVGDDAPFFFFTFKTADALRAVLAGSGRGIDWKNNLGTVVLGILLVISAAAVLAFLVLPLALHQPARAQRLLPLLYFVAVGLGYITVEIALIQRFVLFLGHPTYALTVVVFLMLLASGAGSLVSRRWLAGAERVWVVIALIVAGVAAYVFLLPRVLAGMVGIAFPAKLLLSAVLIVPLGFLMGMPFPTGLRSLRRGVEWAWAMNAAASVLGSVAAMVVAIHFGLAVTLAAGAGAYMAAAGLSRALRA